MPIKVLPNALWYCNGCNVVIVAPWSIGFVQKSVFCYRGRCPACEETRDFFIVGGEHIETL